MRVTHQPEESALRLELDDLDAAQGFFADLKEKNGFYLDLDRELKHLERLTVTVTAPPRFTFTFAAEVVQTFPAGGRCGIAFQLCDGGRDRDAELARQLRGEPAEPSGQVSPVFKIRKMNPTERFRLATQATRIERSILIRDNSPHVLLGLLAHPRIEVKEVLEIIKSTHASAGIMERVAKNRKWMSNPEIQLAIVKSPKTPPPVAINLMENLRTPDLRGLAKSSALRETVRKAALRVHLKRGGRKE
jgi:hypothetical protein